MLIDFALLTVVFFIFFLYTFIIKKDYERISFLYSFSLMTIFYTPNLYFFLGGESYRFFSDESLVEYFHISTITFVLYTLLSVIIDSLKIKKNELNIKSNIFILIYFLFFLIPILAYYIIYVKQFPLVHLFITGELIKRPDMTGSIPHFYTVSTIVSIIIPSIYFFYFHQLKSKYYHLAINLVLFFLFIASGNKGFIAYYFIFLWIYIFNMKVDLKFFLMFIFLIFIYMISKGILEVNSDTLSYMMDSPFRRFFVTQGTGFIHRIDMVNEGFDFINNADPRGLKFDVFKHMYNLNIVGSAPTFYTGDFFAKYGAHISFLIFIVISSILLYASNYLFKLKTNIKLFIYWNIYATLFMVVMAEINFINFLRIMVSTLNIYIVIFLGKIVIKKEFKNNV